jgi:serine/threonine-protein kinase
LPNVPEPVTVVEPKPVEQPKIEPEPVKPEPVATPEPKRRVPAKKAKKATGKLSLKTTPWTTVYLGSRKLGDTPLVNLALPVGTHTLKLVGSDGSLQTTVEVEILANETTVKKLKF